MSDKPDFGEPWTATKSLEAGKWAVFHRDGYCTKVPRKLPMGRAVTCVNACAGMADPVAEIAHLRAQLAAAEARAGRLAAFVRADDATYKALFEKLTGPALFRRWVRDHRNA